MKLQEYEVDELRLRSAVDSGIQRAGKRALPRRALVLAIAAVLLLSAGALAGALMRGSVDWDGRFEPQESMPEPTAASPEEEQGWALAEKAGLLMESAPDDELWVCTLPDGSSHMHQPREALSDLPGAQACIAVAGLLLPGYVPEGFALESCEISFFFAPDMLDQAAPYEQTDMDGMTLRKYRIGAEHRDNIRGYALNYANADGRTVTIQAELASANWSMSFGLDGAETYKTVDIPGMAKALYIQNPDGFDILYAKQEGLAPRKYIDITELWMQEDAYVAVYDAAFFSLCTEALDEQEMLKIARGLQLP